MTASFEFLDKTVSADWLYKNEKSAARQPIFEMIYSALALSF
ncbi:hypothetical protein [Acinetobacter colistiniresistens]|nr:hypothetical protein [Acinetobacter colistiniresistens]